MDRPVSCILHILHIVNVALRSQFHNQKHKRLSLCIHQPDENLNMAVQCGCLVTGQMSISFKACKVNSPNFCFLKGIIIIMSGTVVIHCYLKQPLSFFLHTRRKTSALTFLHTRCVRQSFQSFFIIKDFNSITFYFRVPNFILHKVQNFIYKMLRFYKNNYDMATLQSNK